MMSLPYIAMILAMFAVLASGLYPSKSKAEYLRYFRQKIREHSENQIDLLTADDSEGVQSFKIVATSKLEKHKVYLKIPC